jgi:hypothetical protein
MDSPFSIPEADVAADIGGDIRPSAIKRPMGELATHAGG